MREKKRILLLTAMALSASLLIFTFTALFIIERYKLISVQTIGEILQRIIEKQPEAEAVVLQSLKEIQLNPDTPLSGNILLQFGYSPNNLFPSVEKEIALTALAGLAAGSFILLYLLLFMHKRYVFRIRSLSTYLEKINSGDRDVLFYSGEDDFSRLQDEMYKTVTTLFQTREAALSSKSRYAENLANIAHQIKTPITSMSLSTQMMKDTPFPEYPDQIQTQLSRLARLEESLLLLARIDAGVLPLETKCVDVFTLLVLAADNLEELMQKAGVSVDIPEFGEISIQADLEWTMEAIINILKNCVEHTPSGGVIHCSCEQNPLYTQIEIWDTGSGFSKEDLPNLFERFYRGKSAVQGGIGIGLSLSKEIITNQNGTIRARNTEDGGACFEIRFYCH